MANSGDNIDQLREYLKLLKDEEKALGLSLDKRKKQSLLEEQRVIQQKIINALEKEALDTTNKDVQATRKKLKEEKEFLGVLSKQLEKQKNISDVLKNIWSSTRSTRDYLMQSDKAIKSISLEFGITSAKSKIVRSSIEKSASFAAKLGISTGELAIATKIYADETGRAAILSEESYKAIAKIASGTGLGIENAAKLAGQFELMGLNAENSASSIEQIFDVTDRMGVNATKVFKNISTNFGRLQSMTFRNGVKDFAKMAAYSEKFKVDMSAMIDSADRARTLEGAVDLAAQLQVMGGEFAKSDPFELLFLSRNDPAKFTQKINEMVKGVATFKKNSDGVMETFISPVDIDRLNKVGEALGMSKDQLAEQAKQMTLIQRMRSDMIGKGFDEEQKTIVEGMARLNGKTGKFSIAGVTDDISKLTASQINGLKAQKSSLEDRAKASQSFEEAFQNTLMSLKATLLPTLNLVNKILEGVRPVVEKGVEWVDKLGDVWKIGAAVIVGLSGGALALKGAFSFAGSMLGKIGMGGNNSTSRGGLGKGLLKGGAGIGLGAAGVGAGIMMAGTGISMIADSLKGLDDKQLKTLKNLGIGLGAFMLAMPLLAASLPVTVPVMYAFGGAIALVGAGIGIASLGMSKMVDSISKLDKDVNLTKIATGIGAIGVASMMMGNPLSMVGSLALGKTISSIAKHSNDIQKLGVGLTPLNTLLNSDASNLKEIRAVLQDISKLQSNTSSFSSLASILSKPLKVEFADKEVAMNLKVDMYLDSDKISNGLNLSRRVEIQSSDQKQGLASAS